MQIREDDPATTHGAPAASGLPASADLAPVYRMHAELCKALANEHRQAILHAIGDGEKCVGDLAAEVGISVYNVSQHLRVLKERGLVAARKEAQTVYYRVTNMKFIQACALIRQALVEQHLAQGESLQAAELLDATSGTASRGRARTASRGGARTAPRAGTGAAPQAEARTAPRRAGRRAARRETTSPPAPV